jgi:hypothetical protein
MSMNTGSRALCASIMMLGLPASAMANDISIGTTTLTWGGYLKADAIYSQFSEGRVAQGGGRDFYLPSAIPVSAGGGDSYSVLDAHAKETRLFVAAKTHYQGLAIGGHIEFDFIVNQGGADERVTNAYNPGLRRAFITLNNWLIGQEWTTFQNLGAIPETLDFVAFPSEGTVFGRQPMVRYTHGGFAIALENPESTIQNGVSGGNPVRLTTQDGRIPDLTARYLFKVSDATLGLAVLVREISVDQGGLDDRETGAGVSFSGKVPLGAPDLRFMVTTGEGIGRYVALNTAVDAAIDANMTLDAVGITAGYIAYRQPWSPKWRSTLTYSHLSVDNNVAISGGGATKTVSSVSLNLLYSPAPKITTGVEFRHAERETENGDDGTLDRVQFSAKYAF